jgi:2-phospho-L-lactate guanylyltransferase
VTETWALVPAKSPELAKTRLSAILQPDECAALSRAMLRDVLLALESCHSIDRIALLTNDTAISELVKDARHTAIADVTAEQSSPDSLCAGLNAAAKFIAAQGGTTLIIIPGDLPTLCPADLDELLSKHDSNAQPGLSLCPAIRDGGTNALVCTPPDALKFQYGTDSARVHIETATQHGLNAQRLPMQAFFRDIDMPEDLFWLSQQQEDSVTNTYLRESGIFARLDPASLRASA